MPERNIFAAWLMGTCCLIASFPCFAAGSFDIDFSGHDSLVLVGGDGYGWAIWGWTLDSRGVVVKETPGEKNYNLGFVTQCCVRNMGDYNGDGFADVVDSASVLTNLGLRLVPAILPLRNLQKTSIEKDLHADWNDSVVIGRFVSAQRDSLFARVRVNSSVSGLPENRCMFNDWVIEGPDGIPVACPTPPYTAVGAGDLDGDGYSDIFFRDPASGRNWVWFIRAGALVGEQAWPAVDPAWQLVAVGDTSGSGTTDLVWQHASGFLTRQRVKNRTIVGEDALAALTPDWVVESSGDYDGDGMRDLVIRNVATTELAVLFLDGHGVRNSALLPHPQDDVRYVWRPMPAK